MFILWRISLTSRKVSRFLSNVPTFRNLLSLPPRYRIFSLIHHPPREILKRDHCFQAHARRCSHLPLSYRNAIVTRSSTYIRGERIKLVENKEGDKELSLHAQRGFCYLEKDEGTEKRDKRKKKSGLSRSPPWRSTSNTRNIWSDHIR